MSDINTQEHIREIIQLILSGTPEQMLEKALRACIDVAGARGGSILGEEGPYLKFLFSDVKELVGMQVPFDSIAGVTARKNLIVYTYAPKDKRHFKGVDEQIETSTQYLLSVPIASIHRSRDESRVSAAGALQLLFDKNIMPEFGQDSGAVEYSVDDFKDTSACKEHLEQVFWILPNIALGFEIMNLRQTSYQAIHELKNKMISALSWFNYMKDDIAEAAPEILEQEAIKEDAQLTSMSIEEGADLAKTYLQFTKIYSPHFEDINVNEALTQTAASVKALARDMKSEDFQVNLELDPGMPEKSLDPNQLKMAFFNLCKNGVEALIQHGAVSPAITITSSHDDNNDLEIIIADNGPGMPKEIAENLFVPFKTKKEGGTGLGLTITKKIVDVHGGQISCQTGPEGTRFIIKI